MADVTYTDIEDTDIDPESPITTTLMTRMRDNPIAQAAGVSGAPKTSALAQLHFMNSFWGNYGDGSDAAKVVSTSEALAPGVYNYTTLDITGAGVLSLSSRGPLILRCSTSFIMADSAQIDVSGIGGLYGVGSNTTGGSGEGQDAAGGSGLQSGITLLNSMFPPIFVGGSGGGGGGGGSSGGSGGGSGGSSFGVDSGAGAPSSSISTGGAGGAPTDAIVQHMLSFGTVPFFGGGGGGGGGSDDAFGGNGGAGGGLVVVVSPIITLGVGGTINASGADGVSRGTAKGGSGGGGGGGGVYLLAHTYTNTSTVINVAGGAGGTGDRGNGGDGGAGVSEQFSI